MNNVSILLIYLIFLGYSFGKSPFTYYPHDKYEEIMIKMDSVNRDNCLLKSWDELTLPIDAVGMLPVFNSLYKTPWVANRSSLLHMHNMAMNRGFFYSYILQRLNTSIDDFPELPGLHYYYLSAASDVSANPGIINGSSVFFDTDCQYANWIENLQFNETLPLFGPKAWRLDDWNDEVNWLRGEPTNFTIEITDYGAGPNNNYTSPQYKFNPWMKDKDMQIDFIPDYVYSNARAHQTNVLIREKFENGTVSEVSRPFFGPPQPGIKEDFQPVRFTRPYFDCKRSKKWIVTAVGPVIDYMARYVPPQVLNVRRSRIVGVTTMDIDFLRIDFNPCPASEGNPSHYFANVARCKETTMCEALFHFGFYRGGYQCNCRPGYRLPYYQNGPFQGVDIEKATEEEYASGFDCLKMNWMHTTPTVDGITDEENFRKKRSIETEEENIDSWNDDTTKWLRTEAKKASINRWNKLTVKQFGSKLKSKFIPPPNTEEEKPKVEERKFETFTHPKYPEPKTLKKYHENLRKKRETSPKLVQSRKKRSLDYVGRLSGFEPDKLPKMDKMINFINNVTIGNCKSFSMDQLNLPGEIGYGSETHFEMQGRVALRLAHFLSAYYQNNIKNEKYGNLRPGKTINREHLFGEVLANVMSDLKIKSSGVLFDRQKFVDDNDTRRDLFGPYAFKEEGSKQAYVGIDLGSKAFTPYTEKSWFKVLKERWGSNAYGLERFTGKPWIRSDINGSQIQRYFHYPLFYYAPRYQDGYWSNPFFDCDGFVPSWIMMYSAPFFGNVGSSGRVEFMGVVTVSVPLSELDISQCPSSFYTPNYFKNTATCDYRSSYCTQIPGRKFLLGNYKCECRQGYEYPFADSLWFYPGQLLEKEYRNKLKGIANRYDTLQCRESIGSRIYISTTLLVVSILTAVMRI